MLYNQMISKRGWHPSLFGMPNKIHGLAISISFMLSAWAAYAQTIPNPDGIFYLRAAELFLAGRWQDGFSTYPWSFYSLLVAMLGKLTYSSAPIAAQILNALLDGATVVIFISLATLLSPRHLRSKIAACAAVVILLHPRLLTLRPVVVRDHGFYTFVLLSLYLVARDQYRPNLWGKISIAASLVVATLFRIEALYLLLIVPSYYLFVRLSSPAAKAATVMLVLISSLLLMPGYLAWASRSISLAVLTGAIGSAEFLARLSIATLQFSKATNELTAILPPSRNSGEIAYIGIVVAITIDTILRATTIPLAVLAGLAVAPRRLIEPPTLQFVVWFSAWQLPLLLIFTGISLYLDWRYAMTFALILAIPIVFTLQDAVERARSASLTAKIALAVVALALAIPALAAVPRPSKLEHLRQAGTWIEQNIPKHSTILTNDARIAYFTGRPYVEFILSHAPTREELSRANYAAIESTRHASPSPLPLPQDRNAHLVGTIDGRQKTVHIYRVW